MNSLAKDIDTMYKQAARGNFEFFEKLDKGELLKWVTPVGKDTILHIYITAGGLLGDESCWGKYKHFLFRMSSIILDGTGILRSNFVISVLRKCDAMLLVANANDETLLHLAAKYGNSDIVRVLILETQNDKATYEDEETAKATPEVQEATKTLLGKINNAGDTALHEAARYNHLQVVTTLIDADRNHSYGTNCDGKTPLYLAAEMGNYDVVHKILLSWTSPEYQGPKGKNALHAAVLRNDTKITRLLASKLKGLTKEADESGWVPLHYAAKEGFLGVVKKLMEEDKLAATIGDKSNMTALHIAAKYRRADVMSKILSRCPQCYELEDINGRNLLHFVVESNCKKTLAAALCNPFVRLNLVDRKNKEGKRPLDQLPSTFDFYQFAKSTLFPQSGTEDEDEDEDDADDIDKGKEGTGTERVSAKDSSKDEGDENKKGTGKGKVIRDDKSYKKELQNYFMVATLIATVTFAAVFTMPGGYISDKGPDPGSPVLMKLKSFKVFVVADVISLAFSVSAVIIPIYIVEHKKKSYRAGTVIAAASTFYGLIAMMVAFSAGAYAVLDRSSKWLPIFCYVFPPIAIMYFIYGYYYVLRLQVMLKGYLRLLN